MSDQGSALIPVPGRERLTHLQFFRVTQRSNGPSLDDVSAEIRRKLLGSSLKSKWPAGARIAVAVGSRGIAQLALMVRTAIVTLKDMGYQPFVVAAMGSHGGATAQGQRQLLASNGITDAALGVPVRCEMDVVKLGDNSWGEPVYWDRNAFEADAVITLGRIKPHTDFTGTYESGIVKMLVIGLGKREGAATHHQYGVRGLRDMIPASIEVILAKTKFALGLAVVENAQDEPEIIEAVEVDELLTTEPRLLKLARQHMACIPFDQLDLLVIGELGKNYSGTGLDVNVLGRQMIEGEPDACVPKITRICLLDLSPESHGNATGVGIADLISMPLLDKIDPVVSHTNSLTSCCLLRSKVPIDLPNDRDCIAMGLQTCWQPKPERLRVAVIPNTLELTYLWVTLALAEEARRDDLLEVGAVARALPFTAQGQLEQETLFPHSLRARRSHGCSAHS